MDLVLAATRRTMLPHQPVCATLTSTARAQLIETILAFIKANPAKSAEWKAEADAKMSEQDSA